MAGSSDAIDLWSTIWEPMPESKPKVRRCPTCKSVPLWRHNLNCYWLVCTKCGLETAASQSMEDVATVWNIGSEENERVAGTLEITKQSIDEIVDEVMAGKKR